MDCISPKCRNRQPFIASDTPDGPRYVRCGVCGAQGPKKDTDRRDKASLDARDANAMAAWREIAEIVHPPNTMTEVCSEKCINPKCGKPIGYLMSEQDPRQLLEGPFYVKCGSCGAEGPRTDGDSWCEAMCEDEIELAVDAWDWIADAARLGWSQVDRWRRERRAQEVPA